jgi:acetolactate synthase-1/3 small subunit
MNEANVTRRTLSVLVENAAGVLSQVSRLFSRKGYNIESLAVGTTDAPAVSRITIEVWADKPMIEQIMNQLRKQFSVYSVQELLPERSIRRELVMFKVRAETPDIRNEIIQIANIFRASIIDVSLKSLTLALIGDETKADAMQKLLEAFGILELVRTGMVALERGAYTIGDETKEQRRTGRLRWAPPWGGAARSAVQAFSPEAKTLAQGQFTCPEDVNSRPEGSQTRRRVWDMQTEFYLGKNFL